MKTIKIPHEIPYAYGTKNKFIPVLITRDNNIRESEAVKITSPNYSDIYGRVLFRVQCPFSSLSHCLLATIMGKTKTTKREAGAFFKVHPSRIVTVLLVEKIPYFTGRKLEEEHRKAKHEFNPETDAYVTDPAQKKIEAVAK